MLFSEKFLSLRTLTQVLIFVLVLRSLNQVPKNDGRSRSFT